MFSKSPKSNEEKLTFSKQKMRNPAQRLAKPSLLHIKYTTKVLTCVHGLTMKTKFWQTRVSGRRRQWHPTPVLLPGKSHGWRSLVGCSPWGHWGSDTTELLHFHFSLSCTGEGNGNPLQCSCLENSRDGGAWWAAVYGVTQSRTQLKWLSSSRVSGTHPWAQFLKGKIEDISYSVVGILSSMNFEQITLFSTATILSAKFQSELLRCF